MKIFIYFAAIILAVGALTDSDKWNTFKTQHVKSYNSIEEEKLRFNIFQNNLRIIEQHNAKYERGLVSYYMGINKFTDKTPEEFKSMLSYQKLSKPELEKTHIYSPPNNLQIPDSLDWRVQGAVLEVKDQQDCGACWAFSSTGALEGQNKILYNKTISLSEQQLIDCSDENAGCNGGLMKSAFRYLEEYGLQSEADYPYIANDGRCQYDESKVVLPKIYGYTEIQQLNEDALVHGIASLGPVAVAINADGIQNYAGGIYDDAENCPNENNDLNHGVLAVGYNVTGNYYIIKNSWGTSWGENGFFKLVRGVNICGIGWDTSVPILV